MNPIYPDYPAPPWPDRRSIPPETVPPGYLPWYAYAAPPQPAAPPEPPVSPGGIPKLAYTVEEAAQALSVSPRTVYNLIHSSGFPSLKVGGRRKISVELLAEWVRRKARGEEL